LVAQNGSYHGSRFPGEEDLVFLAIMKMFFIAILMIICTFLLVSGRAERYQKKEDD